MHEYRAVIQRMRLGQSNRAIARDGIVSRGKADNIKKIAMEVGWLNSDCHLPEDSEIAKVVSQHQSSQSKATSKVASYAEQIEQWVEQGIDATVIHRALVEQHDFGGAYNCVQRFVKKIKVNNPDITIPLNFKIAEAAQVDFGFGPRLLNPDTGKIVKTWFFVMTLCWSRHQYAEIVYDQSVSTWLGCHRRAFEWFGGVPGKIIIDNAKCAITKACYYDPTVQRAYQECAEGFGFIISACPPHDPQKKGRVESGVKYVKKNFVPLRTFKGITDANQQLKQWILETAGNRIHGSTRQKPLSMFEEVEREQLKSLPDVYPEACIWKQQRVYRDCHLRFNKCRYSAPYTLVNQEIWLRATETTIRIYHENEMVAIHSRINTPDTPATKMEHLPPKASEFLTKNPQWCLEQAKLIGSACFEVVNLLLNDKVVDYLRAAQGLIKLEQTFGGLRLESACKRALTYETPKYSTINTILKKGLDSASLEDIAAFDVLGEAYAGKGKYHRDPQEFSN